MARKSSGYGAACYYAGKLVGRCTPADAQGYEQLMKSCGGNAARVLQEYAYFSPELRGILEKVAAKISTRRQLILLKKWTRRGL